MCGVALAISPHDTDMIRSTCAWLLLLLAASPVTAPFSTCDLRVFATRAAAIQLNAPLAHFGSFSAAESDRGDADSVSPIVSRVALSHDSHSSVAVLPLRVPALTAVGRVRIPLDLNRSPHDLPPSLTVLRV